MKKLQTLLLISVSCIFTACDKSEETDPVIDPLAPDYMAEIDPVDFNSIIDNPYLSFIADATFTYIGQTEEGTERTEIEVLEETRVIMGVTCTIVRDIVYLNDQVIEDTQDWYAQDKEGNVWYFGEEVDNYEGGIIADNDGSWEAGVEGAEPGIIMLGNPIPGLLYRQEYYKGEAEDRSEIVGTNETVTIGIGTYANCLKTRETTPLEQDVLEYKYYAPGIGLIKVENVTDNESEELVTYNN